MYLGLPNVVRVDQEASFNSDKFMSLAEAHGINLQFSGVESHNALGKGERYHAPLQSVYQILAKNRPSLSKELLLRYAIKGVNDTANIDGLVPSLLVFAVVPTFPMRNSQLPGQKSRLQAIVDARIEMGNIVAEQRITRALKSNPPAVLQDIKTGTTCWFTGIKQPDGSVLIESIVLKTKKFLSLMENSVDHSV